MLRKRNTRNIKNKIVLFQNGKIDSEEFSEIFQGWSAYANLANSYKLICNLKIMEKNNQLNKYEIEIKQSEKGDWYIGSLKIRGNTKEEIKNALEDSVSIVAKFLQKIKTNS